MPPEPPDDRRLAQACLDGCEADWSELDARINALAFCRVHGGARFDADDVAARVLGALDGRWRSSLVRVAAGELSLDVVLRRLVRQAHCEMTEYHSRSKRGLGDQREVRLFDRQHEVSLSAREDGTATIDLPSRSGILDDRSEMTWSDLIVSEWYGLYQEGLAWIHRDGPDWGRSAPYYALTLLDERRVWADLLAGWHLAGAPSEASMVVVPWSAFVGQRSMGPGFTLDDTWRILAGDGSDPRLAEVLGHHSTNQIQQWRHRAQDKLRAGKSLIWLRERFPHRTWT